jgi:hypothetical protein
VITIPKQLITMPKRVITMAETRNFYSVPGKDPLQPVQR